MTIEEENKYLKEKIKKLERKIKELETEIETEKESSAWDFHWDGRGSYEQSRAGFYGEFS